MSRMFVPGPVDVADEVLAAQTRPMLPHRSKEFETIFQQRLGQGAPPVLYRLARFPGDRLGHRLA